MNNSINVIKNEYKTLKNILKNFKSQGKLYSKDLMKQFMIYFNLNIYIQKSMEATLQVY